MPCEIALKTAIVFHCYDQYDEKIFGLKIMRKTIYRNVLLAGMLLWIGCAKQMPPPGGPVDNIPPEIVRSVPAPGETNVPTHAKIEIIFSEAMNHKSVENAIFISPWPSERVWFRWSRKKLKIAFGDTLKLNRTYVVTVGARASDLRNNQMKSSFSLAFSTGEQIDIGQISGTVYGPTGAEGTLVCAYARQDSTDVDPARLLADYYTQTGQNGQYQLRHIAPGKYRLFAIRDRDGNRKYTRGIDGLGIATGDVELTAERTALSDVNFQIFVEDTIPPAVKSVYAVNHTAIVVRFSEALNDFDESQPENYFTLTLAKDTIQQLGIRSCYKNRLDAATVFLSTEPQRAENYRLSARNLIDLSGQPLDSRQAQAEFIGNTAPDTVRPTIVFRSITDQAKGIQLKPDIQFGFSEPMDTVTFSRSFSLRDRDSLLVAGKFQWNSPADVAFVVERTLRSAWDYFIHLDIDSIKDLAGNRLADTLAVVRFRTINQDTLSAIAGAVIDEHPEATGKIYMTAKSEQNSYNLMLDGPGEYRFDDILPGIYIIHGFRDADGNGSYSYGQAVPFQPAERFFYYPDSIKVRSRWPNEGNDILFK